MPFGNNTDKHSNVCAAFIAIHDQFHEICHCIHVVLWVNFSRDYWMMHSNFCGYRACCDRHSHRFVHHFLNSLPPIYLLYSNFRIAQMPLHDVYIRYAKQSCCECCLFENVRYNFSTSNFGMTNMVKRMFHGSQCAKYSNKQRIHVTIAVELAENRIWGPMGNRCVFHLYVLSVRSRLNDGNCFNFIGIAMLNLHVKWNF